MPGEIDSLQIKIAADSQSASENVLALARSLESLSASAIKAANPLNAFSKALGGIKSVNTSGITRAAEDLSKAFQQFNNIGSIDNAVQFIDSLDNLREAMSGLSEISQRAKDFKIGKGFANSIETLSQALPKLSGIGNVDDAIAVLESVDNLEQATSGLKNISENINSLKVGTSFDKNLENLSLAMAHLNEIGDTSAFSGGVEAISQAIERLNNIEVGEGFIRLIRASTQWADAVDRINDTKVGQDFSAGIARFAKACEILNDVDFSGFRQMNELLGELPDNVQVSFGASTSEVQQLTKSLAELQSTVRSISSAMPQKRPKNPGSSEESDNNNADYSWRTEEVQQVLASAQALTDEEKAIQKVLAAYEKMGAEVPAQIQEIAESLGVLQNETEAANPAILSEQTQEVIEQANAWKQDQKAIQEALDAYSEMGMKVPADLRKLAEAYGLIETRLEQFKESLKSVASTVASGAFKVFGAEVRAVMSPLTAIGNKFKSLTEKAGQFLSSIKRIAMYRAIRAALKAVSEGFEEGRKNLYYYSQAVGTDFAPSMDKAATAALYLKNSIGAATAPLTNYLVPMIDRAVDSIVVLVNKFNELTAVLTGASTWTKAVKFPTTWQESLDDANKSAKKLKSTMLGFDELNVIELTDNSSKKSGFDADDYVKMFEEVKTDLSVGSKIPELLMPIKLAWDAQGDKTIGKIKDTWSEILGLIHAVGDSIRTVWTNGTGQKSLELILEIVQHIVGTFGKLAKGIRKAWQENETGTRIIQTIWNIANNVLTVFRDIWKTIEDWASSLDWSPLLTALASLGEALERITDPDGALARLAKSAFEKVLLPIGKWLIEQGLPAAVDLLTTAFDALGVALEFLEPLFQKVIDFLSQIAGFTFNNIAGLASGFSAMVEGISGKEIDGAKGQRAEKANENLVNALGGKDSWYGKLNEGIIDFGAHEFADIFDKTLPSIGERASEILNGTETEKSIFGKIEEGSMNVGIKAAEVVENIKTDWTNGWDAIKTAVVNVIDSIKQFFVDLWESIKNGFNTFIEDWGNGLDAIAEGAANLWDKIKTFFADGWDVIKQGITAFKEHWETGWNAIKDFVSNAWDDIKTYLTVGWTAISNGFDNFKKDFSNGMNAIKDTAKKAWDKISSTLSSKWDDFKKHVDDYKSDWKTGFDDITDHVSEAWEKIKGKIGDTINWQNLKQHVTDFAGHWFDKFGEIKRNVSDVMQKVHDNISDKVGRIADAIRNSAIGQAVSDITSSITDAVSKIWGDDSSGIKGTLKKIADGLYGFIEQIFDGWHLGSIGEKIKGTLNNVIDAFETAINYIIKGLNFFVENANDALDIHLEIPSWVPLIGGNSFDGFQLPTIPEFTFYKFANGGFPDKGSLFLANEPGNPEMVGKIGNQTAVANNDQIVTAVSRGVYDAMISAMAQQSRNGESGKTELHVYLDRQEITSQVEQQQRDNGVSIMSGLVYT